MAVNPTKAKFSLSNITKEAVAAVPTVSLSTSKIEGQNQETNLYLQ